MATVVSHLALHDAERTPPSRSPCVLPDRSLWHETAPEAVRCAVDWSTGSEGWIAWCAHLARRSNPCSLADLLPGKAVLQWGVPTCTDEAGACPHDGHARETSDLIRRVDRLTRKKRGDYDGSLAAELATWLEGPEHRCSRDHALECLAWARALPRLATVVAAGLWWRLLAELLRVAEHAWPTVEADPLANQLLGVELPLSLVHQFPEIVPCRELGKGAVANWEAGISATVDVDGLVHQRNLPLVRPLLACWTRVKPIVEQLDDGRVSPTVSARYRRFVRQALRFTRLDGSMALTADRPAKGDAALFVAAADGREIDRRIARSIFVGTRLTGKRRNDGVLPPPSAHSEAAGLAVLRPSWSRRGERLWVAYGAGEVRVELACARDRLLCGAWQFEIRIDGKPVAPRGSWVEVCWVSDEDSDYLELEISLSDHVRLQRQMLLAREDRLLLLADVVLGDRAAAIEYRGTLPLADAVLFDAAGETREGYLVGRKPRAVVFPLALPEWRSEACRGSLDATEGGLELRLLRPSAQRLYAPLLFDLDAERIFRPATWRTLTVAENRAVAPSDVAVGYRAQLGKEQWLFYRSLAAQGNRTLLGQNLVSDFLAARFNRNGEAEPLLEIE